MKKETLVGSLAMVLAVTGCKSDDDPVIKAAGHSGGTSTGGSSNVGGATGDGGSSGATSSSDGGPNGSCPVLPTVPTPSANDSDVVAGHLVQFNDNGAWCWYQDERVLVDTKRGKLIIGSVASGGPRDGNIEATLYDIASGNTQRSVLGNLTVDDHNAPAFAIRPDGKYVAMWSGHRIDCNSYYSIFDGQNWGAQQAYAWTPQGCPWDPDASPPQMITYSNLWYMSTEGRLYSGVRSVDTSPNLLASTDDGQTWSYYGQLTATPRVGYVAGYYKYWGNGTDRIDFVGTEAHPRDFDNSLWHGYVQGGHIYNSMGEVIDDTVADANGHDITEFTPVFNTGTVIHGVQLDHAWNHDIVRYADGTIAILWQARVAGTGTDDPDKRMLYARFDGASWKLTYLVKGGPKLFASEEDYIGLGALHPNNPHIIYVSTTIDPRDDTTDLGKHEIFEGITCDDGTTWNWVPITQKSTSDNLRPVVPYWDNDHTALLWWKGTPTTSQQWSAQIVGLITSSQ